MAEKQHSRDAIRTRTALRPRDAATLIIVDRSQREPRVLMGRRRPDQVFLPDTYVFPGGRVDAADRTLARLHPLPPEFAMALKHAMRGRPSDTRAAALALAAIRETFEETGIVIGGRSPSLAQPNSREWAAFFATGYCPRPEQLTFFARAITPPGRPRRYDTRFFLTDATAITDRIEALDGELLDIGWHTIGEARRLKLPTITHHVIDDLARHFAAGKSAPSAPEVPFYFHRNGQFARALLPTTA